LLRLRARPQLLLVVLVAVAFIAVAGARLSGGSVPLPGATPRPSAVVVAAQPSSPASAAAESAAPAASAPAASPVVPVASPAPPVATPVPTLPPTTSGRTYRVKRGDTLYEIARRFDTTVSTLQRLNGLGKSTTLHAGDVLKLP
jgi:LysM repeat protein